MRRKNQQLSEKECVHILTSERRGVLSVHGENGYPYGMPMNFLYEEGKIYFHGAAVGHRMDSLRTDNKVSFCVYDQGCYEEGMLGPQISSVIVFGHIRFIENKAERIAIVRKIALKYEPADYVEKEIRQTEDAVQAYVLIIDRMTGKLVKES
jgi:nitroimidazol reductase NimA-like FMN-containing flavoprotein (pyridoxamine 5'-phosphate oxidase superfamily)